MNTNERINNLIKLLESAVETLPKILKEFGAENAISYFNRIDVNSDGLEEPSFTEPSQPDPDWLLRSHYTHMKVLYTCLSILHSPKIADPYAQRRVLEVLDRSSEYEYIYDAIYNLRNCLLGLPE